MCVTNALKHVLFFWKHKKKYVLYNMNICTMRGSQVTKDNLVLVCLGEEALHTLTLKGSKHNETLSSVDNYYVNMSLIGLLPPSGWKHLIPVYLATCHWLILTAWHNLELLLWEKHNGGSAAGVSVHSSQKQTMGGEGFIMSYCLNKKAEG